MKETEQCPNCGAQLQYRKAGGDIACAYCDTVLWFCDEEPAREPFDAYAVCAAVLFIGGE